MADLDGDAGVGGGVGDIRGVADRAGDPGTALTEIVTRRDARRTGAALYFTGVPCKNGHIAKRWTLNSSCLDCQRERSKAWRANNRERANATMRRYRARQGISNAESHR